MNLSPEIERAISKEYVIKTTRSFLQDCRGKLEIDHKIIEIPQNVLIGMRSRAFIKADSSDVFWGDHFEAVVLIGEEIVGNNKCARYCILRFYFNLDGKMVSEDRYPSDIYE
jgi:hypothetical protein